MCRKNTKYPVILIDGTYATYCQLYVRKYARNNYSSTSGRSIVKIQYDNIGAN